MSGATVRGALWANDLTRLCRPLSPGREYVFVEVRPARLTGQLATAMGVEEDQVHGRLERGRRAFVWNWRAEVVSWLWVSTGKETAAPLRRTLHFSKGDCYGWNAGTLEGHRGRGLFAGLLVHAGWRMARAGCHTMWGGILDANLASQRATATAGFRPILRLVAAHDPPPTRLRMRPADYADERLVERARGLFGEGLACRPTTEHPVTGLAAVQRVRGAGMAGVSDEAAMPGVRRVVGRAKRASTGGRSALSIWDCNLRGYESARGDVKLTRRSRGAGELLPVVAGELGGEAMRVQSAAFGRLPARAGAEAGRGPAAISKNVEAVDIFWQRACPATTGRRGTDAVTRCPLLPEAVRPCGGQEWFIRPQQPIYFLFTARVRGRYSRVLHAPSMESNATITHGEILRRKFFQPLNQRSILLARDASTHHGRNHNDAACMHLVQVQHSLRLVPQ